MALALAALCGSAAAQVDLTLHEATAPEDCDIFLDVPDAAQLSGTLAIVAEDAAERLDVSFAGGRASLSHTQGGVATELAAGDLPAGPAQIILHRQDGVARLVAGYRTICQAYSRAAIDGQVGYALNGLPDPEVTVQPLGEIIFSEDFAWESRSNAAAAWQEALGKWTTAKAGDWTNPDAIKRQQGRLSSNLFAYIGRGDPLALSVTGYPYWTNYAVEVGAKSLEGGAVGLVAYHNSPNDYLLFRATSQTSPDADRGQYQLILVENGERTILAEAPGGVVNNQWYKLRIRLNDGHVYADVDKETVLEAEGLTALSRGRIGLYAEGPTGAKFDDVAVEALRTFNDDFAEGVTPRWRGSLDGWTSARVGEDRNHVLVRQGAGPSLLLAGDDEWENYEISAQVDLRGGAGALVFNADGEDDHDALRWEPGGAATLVALRGGEEKTLATGSLTDIGKGWADVQVNLKDDFIRVRSGDAVICEGIDDDALGGSFGVLAAAGARVDKFEVSVPEPNTADIIGEQFSKEDTMREWARVSGAWLSPSNQARDFGIWWNKGNFYGDTKVTAEIRATRDAQRFVEFILGSDLSTEASGYAFGIRGTDAGGLAIELKRDGAVVGETTTEELQFPVELGLAKRGHILSASVDGVTALLHRDDGPLRGSHVGVRQGGLPLSMNTVAVSTSHVHDYTFSSAPTDWYVRGGVWDVTSRWRCQPEWTWFSGVSEQIAAIWCKRQFTGDQTVELYASFKMMGDADGRGQGYEDPHDINISLCGDGRTLNSGYAFVIGGYLDSKTEIWRNGEVIASTDDPRYLMPKLTDGMPNNMNDFHRRWWQLRAQKDGNTLRFFYDNQLALEVEDPDPIESGYPALWTWQGAIMVARAKVYGEPTGDVLEPVLSTTARDGADDPSGSAGTLLLTSSTHPSLIWDFESDTGEFASLKELDSASLCLDEEDAAEGKACLRITNEEAGGTFGIRAVSTDFRLSEMGTLSFDYKIPPEVRVNIRLIGSAQEYEVALTGGTQVTPGHILLGAIPDVQADGEWHHAEFNLRAGFLRAGGDEKNDRITEVVIGNYKPGRALALGLTANPAGATYWLDNFGVYGAAGGDVTFEIADRRRRATGFSYAIDRDPQTSPTHEIAVEGNRGEFTATGLEPGAWYVHLAACDENNEWADTVHRKFLVDGAPPTIGRAVPDPAEPMAADEIAISLSDDASGIDPDSIRVAVNGEERGVDDPAVTYDPSKGAVCVNLARCLGTVEDGAKVSFAVASVADNAGHVASQQTPYEVTLSFAADKTPPPLPRIVKGGTALCNDTFEPMDPASRGEWQAIPSTGSQIAVDTSTAASGGSSMRAYCTDSRGMFQTYIRQTPFDAGCYRIISFDYLVYPWTRVDLILQTDDGAYRCIKFTDSDSQYARVGQVPNVEADGEWHHAEIDLYDILSKRASTRSYVVRSLKIGGTEWPGNAKGSSFNIDNFRIHSVTSARDELVFEWEAFDGSGIAGASYVLDAEPATEPDDSIDTTEHLARFSEVPEGAVVFHARLKDGAGLWGPTVHHPVTIDNTGIQVAHVSPQPGSTVCTNEISLTLSDEGEDATPPEPATRGGARGGAEVGIDPASITLSVAGVEYGTSNEGLEYVPETGLLTWRGWKVKPEPVAFEDQTKVEVKLVDARDFAGNGLVEPLEFAWTMDFAQDNEPPMAPDVSSATHPTAFYDAFEGTVEAGGLGEWRGSAGTNVELDTANKASGDSSMKCTYAEGKIFRTEVRRTPIDLKRFPYLSFDYCVPPEAQVDFLLVVDGKRVLINFTDNERSARSRVPGVVADGQWHRVTRFDLAAAARQVADGDGALECTMISLYDGGRPETELGASFWIDNFTVYRPGRSAPRLAWETADPTGIQGYSYIVDDQPNTVPDDTLEGTDTSIRLDAPPTGVQFFHIRALDGAGQWSETTHYAIVQQ